MEYITADSEADFYKSEFELKNESHISPWRENYGMYS